MKYHLKKLVPAIIMIVHVSGIFGQFSPGDLAEKHQHLSGNQFCAECHSKGKTVDSQDCLNCHVPIRTRMDQKSGYHGGDEKMNCIKCHSDHNGDNFQMVFWENGRDNFDHSETGYKIEGKHTELTCDKCHLPKYVIDDNVINWEIATRSLDFLSTTFLGLPVQCSGCHEDVHEIKPDSREYSVFSGKLCTDCHDQSDWKNASRKFDHSTTKFPLKLSHAKQNCIKCHPNGSDPEKLNLTFYDTYEKLLCVQCHKDVHQNSYGSTCESCHNEDDWKKPFA
ncbi:MAG: hypothetical protein ACE5D7_04575, partial [Fidelibacterota bacterium]